MESDVHGKGHHVKLEVSWKQCYIAYSSFDHRDTNKNTRVSPTMKFASSLFDG